MCRQFIQLKPADMQVRLTDMYNMLFKIAWKHDIGKFDHGDCSMAKYYCLYMILKVVGDAFQILAGVGVTGDRRVQRFFRDLRVGRTSEGTDEVTVLTAGRAMLKNYR